MQVANWVEAPDPYQAVVRVGAAQEADTLSCRAQFVRRAEILAATRRSLAEEGHDGFTIRSVADACRVTPQTIHNSFGRKTDLLRAALNQHTDLIDSFATQLGEPTVFLSLAQAYYTSAITRPEFMREYLLATIDKKSLRDSLLKYGTEVKVQIFRRMARRNLLRATTDARLAAEQIAYINYQSLLNWAEDNDASRLRERLIFGNGTLLLGIFTPDAAGGVEDWLGSCRQDMPHKVVNELPGFR